MTRNLRRLAAISVLAVTLSLPASVRADAITDWNLIAVQTAATPPGRPGPSMVLDLAAVHGAMYDAVQAIEQDYRPYCGDIQGASGRPDAAAAKAAYDVLVNRFPSQTDPLTTKYNDYLTAKGISILDAGIPVGASAADCMIAMRTNDGSFPSSFPAFFGVDQTGQWFSTAQMAAPWLGFVKPYTMRSPSQFRPKAPPSLTSPEYTRAYNEVKSLGSATGSSRTAEQTDLAHFWNLAYPSVWQTVTRNISVAHVADISDSSRLFALMTMSEADALIAAWDSKSAYNFWRPSMAIRQGDSDGNPKTDGDPTWTPLVPNPPYADYTSGANNISSAAMRALSLFFGSNTMSFSITTTNLTLTDVDTRHYQRFSDVRDEVVEARILEGIHFRFADEKARKQGEHIAQWAHAHYFKPRGDH